MSKSEKIIWFKRVRGSYLPCAWQGWLLYVPFVTFLVTVILAGVGNQDSVSDFLYAIFPYFVCSAVVMHWIAGRFSSK